MKHSLPEGWNTVSVREAVDTIPTTGRKVPQKNYLPEGKFPVIDQGKQLVGGYSNDGRLVLDCELPVVIFGDHTTVKKFINFKFVVGADGVKVLRPKPFLDPKLFFYFLHAIQLEDKGYARHYQHLAKHSVHVPPLPEQKRIVAKIEELFSDLDKAVESLKKAQAQLKTYRQSVLKYAFEGRFTHKNVKPGELPEGWKWVTVQELGEIVTGSTPSKSQKRFYSDEYPFYKPADLDAGVVSDSSDHLSKAGIDQARYLPDGSVLVTCIGATIGKTGLINRGGASNQQINTIIPSELHIPRFVYYFCLSNFFQRKIIDNSSSTTLPILNKSKFMQLPFIDVPIDDQKEIVEQIETRLSEADNLEKTIAASLEKAEATRQSILKKAFEGRLV